MLKLVIFCWILHFVTTFHVAVWWVWFSVVFSEPCENLSSGIIDGEGPDLLKAILTTDPDIFKSGSVYRNSGQFDFLVWKWWVVTQSKRIAEENRELIVWLNFCAHVTYSHSLLLLSIGYGFMSHTEMYSNQKRWVWERLLCLLCPLWESVCWYDFLSPLWCVFKKIHWPLVL